MMVNSGLPMKLLLKIPLVFVLAAVLSVAGPSPGWSFHDNGVAPCNACHTMHYIEEGVPLSGTPNEDLLREATSSDLCLWCHGPTLSDGSVMSADMQNPLKKGKGAGGGDFVFLLEDNLNDGPNGFASPIPGERAGHNVIAPSQGLSPDTANATAPGGGYPSDKLTCTSCHNPHGGPQFRFLYGSDVEKGATSLSMGYSFTFTTSTPEALEMSPAATESNSEHNAYRGGVSDWCETCHGRRVHDDGHGGGFEHPGEHSLEGEQRNNYNHYNGTLDANNQTLSNPYLALVPVQWNSSSNAVSYTGPIDGNARVMCLSCHRAHASSGPFSGRWDFNIETWADEGSFGSYPIENPYASTSGDQQRRLCEKCHGLNEPD